MFTINLLKIAAQSAFFDFCAGNHHQSVARARLKAVKGTPNLWIVRVEVAKVAQRIGLSSKCGTNYTLFCGLARVRVEPVKNSTVNRTFTKFWRVRGWTHIPRALQRMQSGLQSTSSFVG